MTIKVKKLKSVFIALAFIFLWSNTIIKADASVGDTEVVEATEQIIEKAKTGIVEIMSGFYDAQGNFHKMKSGSGFLICNTESETYIVTNRTIVTNSDDAKKKYCEKKEIVIDNNIPSTVIKVIVKGDVSVEVEIVAESQEKDFCILKAENVVSEKNTLRLENNIELQAEDGIYAMGFPNKKDLEYVPQEVECNLGIVQESELNWQDVLYIQHTAQITKGSIGGPLLNKEGYVVGLNCQKTLENQKVVNCALPIQEVIEVLDNFDIYYDSSLRDKWSRELEQLYEECTTLATSKAYKQESLEELKNVLATIDKLQEKTSIEELEESYSNLKEAKEALVLKVDKKQIVIYILGTLVLGAAIWLIILVILRCLDKRKEEPIIHAQTLTQQVQPEKSMNIKKKTVLVQSRTGAIMPITENRMVVGKNPCKVDFCVTDNIMVSREHAEFQQQCGKIYVCDLHSSNGTYVNGRRIPSENFVEIKIGDEVVLANEKFTIQGGKQ